MTMYALGEVEPATPADGDFWVAPDANVIGNCTVKAGASVWFGSTLRGDNELIEIGAGSNIQENCVLHTDPGFELLVGENCTIGHKAMLHGCIIGDGTLIGMGATLLNGAKVGPGSLIGANSLITEGKEIPAGVLVMGSPGKIVRELSAQEQQGLLASAQHYQARMRVFRDQLRAM